MRETLSIGSLLLVLSTWWLWVPQHLFPRIPLWSGIANWPESAYASLNWMLLVAWLVQTMLLAWPKLPARWVRLLGGWYAVPWLMLVALDQHRLQPWAVHIALGLAVVTGMDDRRSRQWVVWLTASIYIYSAISKFDFQFLHTVGQDFLGSFLRLVRVDVEQLSGRFRTGLAALFPAFELLCGVSLLVPVLRKPALFSAVLMHLALLIILGPFGLRHSLGVLIWNALFVGANISLLLVREPEAKQAGPLPIPSRRDRMFQRLVQIVCCVAFVAPLGERIGLVDHWLGWALYAPHSSRAVIYLSPSAAERMDPTAREYLVRAEDDGIDALRLAVDRWSLDALGVPVYPQQRFYVGVAQAIAGPLDEWEIRVRLLGPANRWTGQRVERTLNGRRELTSAGQKYWFNTRPRYGS